MLAAELRGMKPYLVDRVVVPEMEIVSAALQLLELLGVAFRLAELGHLACTFPRFAVSFNATRQCLGTIRPLYRLCRQALVVQGFFLVVSFGPLCWAYYAVMTWPQSLAVTGCRTLVLCIKQMGAFAPILGGHPLTQIPPQSWAKIALLRHTVGLRR